MLPKYVIKCGCLISIANHLMTYYYCGFCTEHTLLCGWDVYQFLVSVVSPDVTGKHEFIRKSEYEMGIIDCN